MPLHLATAVLALVGVADAASLRRAEAANCARREDWIGPAARVEPAAADKWRALPAQRPLRMPAKVGFLMMVYRRLVFPKAWQSLLEGQRNGFVMLLHAKVQPAEVPPFFVPFLFQPEVPGGTARCRLAHLQLAMIGQALRDRAVSHVAFVSGDSLPLQPLAQLSRELEARPESRFCVDAQRERAETWSVLRREDAQLFANHSDALWAMIPSTDCEEEDMFYWPLKTRGVQVLGECPMMADWSGGSKAWAATAARCRCPGLVGELPGGRGGPSRKLPGGCASPATFLDVDPQGLKQLFGSGFWFARKFAGDGPERGGPAVTLRGGRPLDEAIECRADLVGQLRGQGPRDAAARAANASAAGGVTGL